MLSTCEICRRRISIHAPLAGSDRVEYGCDGMYIGTDCECARDNQNLMPYTELQELAGYRALGTLEHLQGIVEAERDGRLVVLDVPRKPLLWGDKDRETVLCPYCREDLMGMTYGERKLLQCPVCGQYLDATIVYDPEGAEVALGGVEGE